MATSLNELEVKLAAAFEASDWDLDAVDLTEVHQLEEAGIRPIEMNVGPLGGSRPRT
ncbi:MULTISPECIES: hypothetical protein [Streptomycetaceae]|uniref:Uncharacterized protein n=1 Tax=Actinacidiphila glaucinigra TaxID=235986 RepID=A0A239IPP8_9ACTN|nr:MULTISPECIES: hypothetical protein [Streptomycetaceae]MYX39414.1 hypothetical protein [Streptomyces sp. SID8377]SNS95352.1 hypothetical protein SAMN05216252_11154 [Actinacidiphila glaucinigra]